LDMTMLIAFAVTVAAVLVALMLSKRLGIV
jgi:hypothetical protein